MYPVYRILKNCHFYCEIKGFFQICQNPKNFDEIYFYMILAYLVLNDAELNEKFDPENEIFNIRNIYSIICQKSEKSLQFYCKIA